MIERREKTQHNDDGDGVSEKLVDWPDDLKQIFVALTHHKTEENTSWIICDRVINLQ